MRKQVQRGQATCPRTPGQQVADPTPDKLPVSLWWGLGNKASLSGNPRWELASVVIFLLSATRGSWIQHGMGPTLSDCLRIEVSPPTLGHQGQSVNPPGVWTRCEMPSSWPPTPGLPCHLQVKSSY